MSFTERNYIENCYKYEQSYTSGPVVVQYRTILGNYEF